MKCVCPVNPREPGDLVGCGMDFEAEPDHEGLVDCPHCGMWHKPQLEAHARVVSLNLEKTE